MERYHPPNPSPTPVSILPIPCPWEPRNGGAWDGNADMYLNVAGPGQGPEFFTPIPSSKLQGVACAQVRCHKGSSQPLQSQPAALSLPVIESERSHSRILAWSWTSHCLRSPLTTLKGLISKCWGIKDTWELFSCSKWES